MDTNQIYDELLKAAKNARVCIARLTPMSSGDPSDTLCDARARAADDADSIRAELSRAIQRVEAAQKRRKQNVLVKLFWRVVPADVYLETRRKFYFKRVAFKRWLIGRFT